MSNGFQTLTENVVEKWVIPYLHNFYMQRSSKTKPKITKKQKINVVAYLYVCMSVFSNSNDFANR